ncbi:MAG: CapA family protein [Actinobacteria bacterium]|nr:CapA family protein [Actinomycetota bacterium]
MTGRAIDQILPFPSDPILFEPYVRDARVYVELAERAGVVIPRPASFSYVWGDALAIWEEVSPAARIVNLETSITTSGDSWSGKSVHYRMNPANIECLREAKLTACCLANNHVLDWGYAGLSETLAVLDHAGIGRAGAGQHKSEAAAPFVVNLEEGGRLLLWSCAALSSGVPLDWAADDDHPGVYLIQELTAEEARSLATAVRSQRRVGDLAIVSIHWGENWGYEIANERRDFAHSLIDSGGIDVIHGHSSHHVLGLEVYQGKLIIYGCGDLLTDYEGIHGFEEYRGSLGLMYFPDLEPETGRLAGLHMYPTQLKGFRLNRAGHEDVTWLVNVLRREGVKLGTGLEILDDESLSLIWD